jgi:hypothetical protein
MTTFVLYGFTCYLNGASYGASAEDIRRALFCDVVKIYGGLPW